MKFWAKYRNRLTIAVALYRQMGFISFSATTQALWLEKQRLDSEVRDLEVRAEQADRKVQSLRRKTFPV